MRRRVLAAGGMALIVMPGVLAFYSGGFFDEPRLIAALASWALFLLAALVAPRPLPVSAAGRTALVALTLLSAWSLLSLRWAPIGERAQDDVQRLLLYLGFFGAALAFLREAPLRRALEPALALSAFAVVAYGLSERLLPGVFELERSASAAGRLEQPLTYWNAMGLISALGFVLAARVAGDPDRPGSLRAGWPARRCHSVSASTSASRAAPWPRSPWGCSSSWRWRRSGALSSEAPSCSSSHRA